MEEEKLPSDHILRRLKEEKKNPVIKRFLKIPKKRRLLLLIHENKEAKEEAYGIGWQKLLEETGEVATLDGYVGRKTNFPYDADLASATKRIDDSVAQGDLTVEEMEKVLKKHHVVVSDDRLKELIGQEERFQRQIKKILKTRKKYLP